MQQNDELPQRRARATKEPGKTLDPVHRAFIRNMCDEDVRPSYKVMQQRVERRFDGLRVAENTIRDICRASLAGETWTLMQASPLQARYVLPVLAAVVEATHGRRTYLTREEARLVTRICIGARGIPPLWAYRVARHLLWAGKAWEDTAPLHHFLAFRPWTPEGAKRYEAAGFPEDPDSIPITRLYAYGPKDDPLIEGFMLYETISPEDRR